MKSSTTSITEPIQAIRHERHLVLKTCGSRKMAFNMKSRKVIEKMREQHEESPVGGGEGNSGDEICRDWIIISHSIAATPTIHESWPGWM